MPQQTDKVFERSWHCPGASQWRRASWPDGVESVLFDRRSGQTHFLSPLATAVLDVVAGGAVSGEDVYDALVPEVDASETDQLRLSLADALRRLEAVGLIDQCDR